MNHQVEMLYPHKWRDEEGNEVTSYLKSKDVERPAPTEGRKDDQDKLRFDLIPVRPLEELAYVYTAGAKKYADRNWEKGLRWGRVFGAMMRHAWAYWRGVQRHEKDMHSLASVAWCAFTLMEYELTHPELDDRPKVD